MITMVGEIRFGKKWKTTDEIIEMSWLGAGLLNKITVNKYICLVWLTTQIIILVDCIFNLPFFGAVQACCQPILSLFRPPVLVKISN